VLIHNLGTKWNWLASFVSLPFTSGERAPGTNWIREGWAPKFVWTLERRWRPLAASKNRIRFLRLGPPAHSLFTTWTELSRLRLLWLDDVNGAN